MGTLITVLIIIASILLTLIVLIQNSEGGGLTSDFGAAQQIGGVKQTNAFIEKATWGLAGFIAILSIALTLMFHTPTVIPDQDQNQQTEQTQQKTQQPQKKGQARPQQQKKAPAPKPVKK